MKPVGGTFPPILRCVLDKATSLMPDPWIHRDPRRWLNHCHLSKWMISLSAREEMFKQKKWKHQLENDIKINNNTKIGKDTSPGLWVPASHGWRVQVTRRFQKSIICKWSSFSEETCSGSSQFVFPFWKFSKKKPPYWGNDYFRPEHMGFQKEMLTLWPRRDL